MFFLLLLFAGGAAAVVFAGEQKLAEPEGRPAIPNESAASERETDTGRNGSSATFGVDATGVASTVVQTEAGPMFSDGDQAALEAKDDGKLPPGPKTPDPVSATPAVQKVAILQLDKVSTLKMSRRQASDRIAEFAKKGGFVV